MISQGEKINELGLFAGAGGGILAGKLLGWRTVCYVEWDKYAIEVLKARIRDGILDDAPIWDDAQTFNGKPWAGSVDIITAGFPCQPFSTTGKQLAEFDPRNMWPATIRIIREIQPRFCLLENVTGLISKPYWGNILGDLAQAGYDAEWGVLSAEAIGAPHKRERVWILAHSNSERFEKRWWRQPVKKTFTRIKYISKNETHTTRNDWWAAEPAVGRVANGVAHRVDRLKTLGNGQVPAVAASAWYLLIERLLKVCCHD